MFIDFIKAYIESCFRLDFLLGLVMLTVPSWYMYKRGYRVGKKVFLFFVVVMIVELITIHSIKYGSEFIFIVFVGTLIILLYRLKKEGE